MAGHRLRPGQNARHGQYEVVGRRKYRGHEPGDRFEAVLDRGAETRAIQRGDIRLLRRITPALQPDSFRLPDGWLDTPAGSHTNEGSRSQ